MKNKSTPNKKKESPLLKPQSPASGAPAKRERTKAAAKPVASADRAKGSAARAPKGVDRFGDARPTAGAARSAVPATKEARPATGGFAAATPAKQRAVGARPPKAGRAEAPKPPRKTALEPGMTPAPHGATQSRPPVKGRAATPKTRATAGGKSTHEGIRLKSGQTVELRILTLNDDGYGVAHHEGARVLVARALPGEHLVARVTYVGRREAFASAIKFLNTSPERIEAPHCNRVRGCDGCMLMQMRYPAQTAWKREQVASELRRYSSQAEVPVLETIPSPKEFGYRNTAKLVVSGKNANPVIGMYRRNSHEVVENFDCPLHHPLINKVIKAAKAGIKKGKVPIYNPKSEMGLLRYLVVRVAQPDDRVMVVLVTTELGYNEMHHLAKYIQQEVPEVTVVAQNINSTSGNVIFGHRERFLTKAQTLRTRIGDTLFALSPRSFLQVNCGAAQIIYEKVRELAALSGTERVIDVYCGIGGISLLLAKDAREVVGIELVEAAVADAVLNAALNRVENCHFEAGDAARLLEEIGSEGGADLIVLNPPRKGCEEKVLVSAAALKPKKMIYVSCSPETLARDLDVLSRLGYRTAQVHPVDMFPQTVHVEDIALLERVPT